MNEEKMDDVEVDIAEPMIVRKYSAKDFERWLLEECTEHQIPETALLNEDLRVLPPDQRDLKLAEEAALKSSQILAVVCIQTLKKNINSTVHDFLVELAGVMERLESKHLRYLEHHRLTVDQFSRLETLMDEYSSAQQHGSLPRSSKASLKPVSLKTGFPGEYSIDIKFGKKDAVVANHIVVANKEETYQIEGKEPFECEVSSANQNFQVLLYNNHHDLLARGTSSIFSEFCKAQIVPAEENFLSSSLVKIPLFRAEGRPVDFVFLENRYSITLPMCEAAISRQRTNLELYQKKLKNKQDALLKAISSIIYSFLHIEFSTEQSCFFFLERVDEEKKEKAKDMRERSRATCGCCLLL